jgi:two-component system, chemotaxis family, protein-glutamate methylesterase/glutaminase
LSHFIDGLTASMNKPLDVLPRPELTEPEASFSRMEIDAVSPLYMPPEVIVIGASTGGPQALDILLQGMAPFIGDVHVFVVLHTLAELMPAVTHHLSNLTSLQVEMAAHHAEAKKGTVYFAPGDRHLGFSNESSHIDMILSDAAPENFCRPSVDFLFRSAAECFGPGVLGIILSGMGSDGLAGSRAIAEAGGSVIVQDKASSVVWGMPGSVAHKALASAILPVNMIAPTLEGLLHPTIGGSRHGI